MFPVVDLINLAGHLLSLGFYLNKKKDQKSILNDPGFQNVLNWVKITQN